MPFYLTREVTMRLTFRTWVGFNLNTGHSVQEQWLEEDREML